MKTNDEYKHKEQFSQERMILLHLMNGQSLTSLEALKLFGCFRLSARIKDLKEKRHDILSEKIKVNGKYVSQYTLKK